MLSTSPQQIDDNAAFSPSGRREPDDPLAGRTPPKQLRSASRRPAPGGPGAGSATVTGIDLGLVMDEVAGAVNLDEGATGVGDVLAAITEDEPVSVRDLSRQVEIPVPVVAAVCNELRRRGLVSALRPVQLTAEGRAVISGRRWPDLGLGEAFGSRDSAAFAWLEDATERLSRVAGNAPQARVDLDQAHCTVETKLRRVRYLARRRLLTRPILFLGDDDLTSLAIALVARAIGAPAPRMAVVDVDTRVLGYLDEQARAIGAGIDLIHHDLARPLPTTVRGRFEVAVTDPPYTLAGASLFVSRAVSALRPGAGQHVVLAFGGRRPDETVGLQRLLTDMRLALRSLKPNFNVYAGAGVLGGTSHLYHLRTTRGSRPCIVGEHEGPLYTADERRDRCRRYLCVECRTAVDVGPSQRLRYIADAKRLGCRQCGSHRFRPLPRSPQGARS
jgi:predicted methyltransferase